MPRRPISTRGESDDLRGIPADLLALWDAEEKRNGKYNVEPANTNDNMFNDLQWKDQWYMVSKVFGIFTASKNSFANVINLMRNFFHKNKSSVSNI